MNALSIPACNLTASNTFFEPIQTNVIEQLLWQYRGTLKHIQKVGEIATDNSNQNAINYFIEGNNDRYTRYTGTVKDLFNVTKAVKALNADYWRKALDATGVLEHMCQTRKSEWTTSIQEMKTPDFCEESVFATLKELLLARENHLSEFVASVFNSLSSEHITNSPAGFGKKMITWYADSYGFVSHTKAGYLNDLRYLIAKLMNRELPKNHSSYQILNSLKDQTGEWFEIDGGAIRIKLFKKGTLHIEVSQEIAWRLNEILAINLPNAIPAEFRRKPKKTKIEDLKFTLTQNFIPTEVLNLLGSSNLARNGLEMWIDYQADKYIKAELTKVLSAIGGVVGTTGKVNFDYDAHAVINYILRVGHLPDHKSHQYYPTSEKVARFVVDNAQIEENHRCLEPSAGTANIAQFMPSHTHCVEVSELHCKVLESKGFTVVNEDFLKFSQNTTKRYDRICLNPPYSLHRFKTHTDAAIRLLDTDGMLVAVLPLSAKKKFETSIDYNVEFLNDFENEFANPQIAVTVMRVTKK